MSVKTFENKYWKEKKQDIVFRHKVALNMIDHGEILDIGSGDGLFMKMLREKGLIPKGIDISEEGIKKCKEKDLNVSLCDFSSEKLPFSENEFDYVVILDVLEHLYSPEYLLKEAKRVSKKNIIISVPNFNSLPARIQMFLGKVPENNTKNKGHIYWFNLKVLKKMLKDNGLEIMDIKMNTFWGMNFLTKISPSVFALSFVIKLEK
ncbi:MAG: methyltransferase domain-containing protein [Candidatus Pacebacteria bacterium]|nr:methyltransferase domain-containing protein [Candidatus Paceibacterota bacterium]